MKRMFADSYLATQQRLEEWFADIRRAAGCGDNADTGAVLRAVEAMSRRLEECEDQQVAVARSRGYRYWGAYYNAVMSEVPEAVPIELPAAYNEVPVGWFRGWKVGGKHQALDKCEKQLLKTHKVIRKALAYIKEQEAYEGEEWGNEQRSAVLTGFMESTDPNSFENECLKLAYEMEEEDPETTWVEAADAAAVALEKATDLPLQATEELIAYAYDEGVEITKKHLAFIEKSDYREAKWFDYLLTAYLRKSNQASEDEVAAVSKLKHRAFELWKCYELESANDPLRPKLMKRVFAPSVSVAMLEAACNEVCRLDEEGNALISDEWADAVVAAVAAANDGNALVIVEK